jgi:hypothetical protein
VAGGLEPDQDRRGGAAADGLCVAYLTLWERKAIGWTQVRPGPNRVGPYGLLTPIADAVKLIFKEIIRPTAANKGLFFLGPVMTIMPALAAWAVVPFGPDVALANVNAGLLFLMAITSLEVYGVIIAGWASNSKYAFLGALRASAQMVSYEIAMGFCAGGGADGRRQHEHERHRASQGKGMFADMGVGFLSWNWLPLLPIFVVYFISGLAETNRHPFDVVEGEVGDRRRPHDRVLGHELRHVLPGRIRQHDPGQHAHRAAVPGRLAAAVRLPGLHPGLDLAGASRSSSWSPCSCGCAPPSRASATTRSCAWAGRSSSPSRWSGWSSSACGSSRPSTSGNEAFGDSRFRGGHARARLNDALTAVKDCSPASCCRAVQGHGAHRPQALPVARTSRCSSRKRRRR